MPDAFLTEALGRLDRRLLDVCAEEERRATQLAGSGGRGWAAVRNLTRPSVAELSGDARPAGDGKQAEPEPDAEPDRDAEPDWGTEPDWDTEPDRDAGRATGLLPGGAHVLRRAGRALGLEECELEVLLVLLAAHVEPRYQSVYGFLQDDLKQRRATERVVHAVLGRDPERHRVLAASLAATGRLVRSGFVTRLEGTFAPLARPLDLPEDVVATLLAPDAGPPRVRARPTPALQVVFGRGDLVATARELRPRGLPVTVVTLPPAPADAEAAARAAWRAGICTGALPLLVLHDVEDDDGHRLPRIARAVEELVGLGGAAWLLCREPLPVPLPHAESRAPSWTVRRDAWRVQAREHGVPLTRAEAGELAARHRLDERALRRAFDVATAAGATPDAAALDAAASRLGTEHVRHGRRTVPERDFDDLVLRPATREALDRLVHFVRHRDQVAENLGLERRYRLQRGPVALFSGLPGTGKTLAAEAVAAALGRPLHTVDVARLVSTHAGETEKNVDAVMSQAERASAVLFLDEADALFGTPGHGSSAGEHVASLLVGYLLQRVEEHDGPTILATDLRGGMDEAFLRRFAFRIEFPLPEADERELIWELMLPDTVPRADDVDLGRLAKTHRLAGGDIRNAALKALFLAHRRGDPVAQDDLEHGVALELLELGRLSRLPGPPGHADLGELLRDALEDLHDRLALRLRNRFLKEIHVVHGSPTEALLAGKKPAVSLALFRVAARRGAEGLRAGFVVSAWSHRAEEETELLGVVHQALTTTPLSPVRGRPARLRVQDSHDFDLLHRFWSSHGQPVRASVVADVEID